MTTAGIVQQQRRAVVVPSAPAAPDCWASWSATQIASATNSPQAAVENNWPAIYAELAKRGIADPAIQAGVLGTIAVETAHTFAPVQEAFWLDDAWRYANLRYAPFWGRGYVQLTWDYNYQSYGAAIGADLAGNPALALDAGIAAAVLAEYFVRASVADAARQQNWTEVRRRVQGGSAGLNELLAVVRALGYPA